MTCHQLYVTDLLWPNIIYGWVVSTPSNYLLIRPEACSHHLPGDAETMPPTSLLVAAENEKSVRGLESSDVQKTLEWVITTGCNGLYSRNFKWGNDKEVGACQKWRSPLPNRGQTCYVDKCRDLSKLSDFTRYDDHRDSMFSFFGVKSSIWYEMQAIPSITTQFHTLDDIGWYGAAYQMTGYVRSIDPLRHIEY